MSRRFKQSAHRAGSSNQHMFSEVPNINMQRSTFDRSTTHKTTFGTSTNVGTSDKPVWADDSSMLIPILCDEVLPGDTHSVDVNALVRMTTPLTPILDGLNLDFHAFFVPNRILWSKWEKFLGAQDKPSDKLPSALPSMTFPAGSKAFLPGSLFDYYGLPTFSDHIDDNWNKNMTSLGLNSLPFRAYNLIWNCWFRDENIQDSCHFDADSDTDDAGDYFLLPRGKRKDYFTSALPWTQKGGDISIPLVDNVAYLKAGTPFFLGEQQGLTSLQGSWSSAETGPWRSFTNKGDDGSDTGAVYLGRTTPETQELKGIHGSVINGDAEVDLSSTGSIVNDIREAFQIQKFLERNARGGTRINEIIRAHFNVHTGDSRIQFPEFLGSGSVGVGIQQVPQTSQTSGNSPLGNLAAYSLNGGGFHFHRSFVEHGYMIVLASIRQNYTYQQGINRMFLRQNRFDFYWPEFSHLGEQPVYRAELDASSTFSVGDNRAVFGFQERYAEYRYIPDRASGLMRSYLPDSLAYWHLGQTFGGHPGQIPSTLSPAFIEEQPPVGRILAVPSQPHFLADFYFKIRSARPMPVYSAPGLVDHF